ncbi:UV radiation resistance-associated gene protein isoform X1 [Ipomoea triloba]|uniref:UV radiation resistance-associated gene protein isoform X1 n=1 Tax=Ipomoea triloba TaxID=35885 RepID=UPI00125DB3DB|nr:UV radiation resistance-associated gene protein isoform X1 [Ipomoea triloba]
MEPKKTVVSSEGGKRNHDEKVKVLQWEDYEQELARLCSLTAALNEAKQKKQLLEEKLQSTLWLEAESLNCSNELDEMREKLEHRKLVMGNTSMNSKVLKEKVKKEEDQLSNDIRSLLVAGTALSLAKKRLQDANRSLAGEMGCGHLKSLQRFVRLRQQFMVSQVQLLYPVKVTTGHAPEQELESFTSIIKSGNYTGQKPLDQGSLTISGLHLTVIPFTKKSFFTDKKEVQRSATALGYVAHAVSLIASYLQVPLRYPLRLGGSRSYVRDYAPSIEPSSLDVISDSLVSTNLKPVEFPLFLEGQDSTRAAYAVFLLNKDLEQLLNYIGARSLGPRHVLANLRELLRTILAPEYIDT